MTGMAAPAQPGFEPARLAFYMEMALAEAAEAARAEEVPAGAVLIDGADGAVLGRGHNQVISLNDPTAHAEIMALRAGATRLANYRLGGTILFSTLEPCPMCLAAAIHARVAAIYFGAPEPKWGAAGSTMNLAAHPGLNHRPFIAGGLMADEARALITAFFRSRRS